MTTEIPRRCRIDLFTPAERAIYDAVGAVEALPGDVRLTRVVVLLQQARDLVADVVDGRAPPGVPFSHSPNGPPVQILFWGSASDLATDVAPFLKTSADVARFLRRLEDKLPAAARTSCTSNQAAAPPPRFLIVDLDKHQESPTLWQYPLLRHFRDAYDRLSMIVDLVDQRRYWGDAGWAPVKTVVAKTPVSGYVAVGRGVFRVSDGEISSSKFVGCETEAAAEYVAGALNRDCQTAAATEAALVAEKLGAGS